MCYPRASSTSGYTLWISFKRHTLSTMCRIFCYFLNLIYLDFAEGKLEFVLGFNVQYRREGFALIFLAENARILFIGILLCAIFWGVEMLIHWS